MLWKTAVQVRGREQKKKKKRLNQEKKNAITFLILNGNTICPSLSFHLFFLLTLMFVFISTIMESRGGLNGNSVASWEQHPDAVWVCKAELQHQ